MNILLNINNFGQEFAYKKLRKIIKKNHRVLIIPFSYHEDYINTPEEFNKHFSKGCEEIEEIINEFNVYGIKRKNIKILNFYKETPNSIKNKFNHSDIIFLTGGYPDRFLYRIDTLGIRDYLVNFKGIVMGTSAGAMIQLDEYHVTPEDYETDYEYHDGLGLISGFDIEVHFEEDFLHLSGLITDLKLHNKLIYAMPNHGGLIVDGDKLTPIGDTFIITTKDIDILQKDLDIICKE